ncbi:CorA family divalent cation transporter [Microvirga sp. BSC39]|uniref:CorA family divalent cation transporter n=1 Tax=Microvirga sp. BSC39 TaxID=1549810 RepID=UPI001362E33D|nr:CorA family divalent cation transporter [Microvirga sp. BSC39]
MISAFKFDELGQSELWQADKALDLSPGEGWVWAHFNLSDARAHQWFTERPELTRQSQEVLTTHDEHAYLRDDGSCLTGMVADLVRNVQGSTEEIGYLHFALSDRLLITARRHPLQGADATRSAVENGMRMATPGELFSAIIANSADGFDELVDRLTINLDRIEDRVLMEKLMDERQRLSRARHTAVRLQRPLASLRRTLRRVRSPAQVASITNFDPGSIMQELEMLEGDLATFQDRARLLQDEINLKVASQTNRQLFVLSVLTALFVPATLITGLFGMNVGGMPFTESPDGFWWGLLVSLLSSLFVCLLLVKAGAIRRQSGS